METSAGRGMASRAAEGDRGRTKQGLGGARPGVEEKMDRRPLGGEDFHLSILQLR